jgi:hypothetical protein
MRRESLLAFLDRASEPVGLPAKLDDETLFIGCHSTVVAVPGWLAVAVQEPEKPVPSEHSRHRLCMI